MDTSDSKSSKPQSDGVPTSSVTSKAIYSSPARQRELRVSSAQTKQMVRRRERPVSAPSPLIPMWLRKSGIGAWCIIGICVVAGAIVFATLKISPVFLAVFIGLVFTSLLNPVVNHLDKHMSRWLAVIIALLGSLAIVSGLVTYVVTSVTGQWSRLGKQLSNGIDKIIEFIESTPFHVSLTSDELYKWLQEMIDKGETYLRENWQSLAGEVLSNASTVGIFFTVIALAIFVTVFFLHSGSQMWRWFLNLLPMEKRANTNRAAEAGWIAFSGYARGTVVISFIDGILAWIFLAVVGVPLAPALGVLVMIGAYIPMIGAPAAMVIAMIVALAIDGVWKAIIVGIGIAAIGQLEGHVLQPLIMGKQVSLHPVVVGLGVVAGAMLGGLLGAVIVIPILGVAWAVFSVLYHKDPPIQGPLPGAIPMKPPEKPATLFAKLKHPLTWIRAHKHEKASKENTSQQSTPSTS